MRKLLATFALAAAASIATPAVASDWFLHAGDSDCDRRHECSLMEATEMESVSTIVISYAIVRPGLVRTGLASGDVLVRGKMINGTFQGQAYRFKRYGDMKCSLSYAVSGSMRGTQLVLEGRSPAFHPSRCASTGLSWDNPQSTLVFHLIKKGGNAPSV